MPIPLEIAYKNMEKSEAVEARVREKVSKLERFAERVMSCRVVIEGPHRHHKHGPCYQVHIDVRVPGDELVVHRNGEHDPAHADIYVALRDAFAAATRQVEEHLRRLSHH